jgi:ubiquinone biosynthesis protein
MVMVEGVAQSLDPDINMWDTAAPFVREWIRSEIGPEAWAADRIIEFGRTVALVPDLIRRLDAKIPKPGAAPPPPPLVDINVVGVRSGWRYGTVALIAALLGSGITLLLT